MLIADCSISLVSTVLKDCRHVSLSTMIVVKMELRDSSHLPRLIEVWLHSYHLVEILYAKDVVFIIYGHTSRHYQSVNIILSRDFS